jgi:hypothetical protein
MHSSYADSGSPGPRRRWTSIAGADDWTCPRVSWIFVVSVTWLPFDEVDHFFCRLWHRTNRR